MKIGNSIKSVRSQRGLSQVELAQKTGLAQNVISRIERDVHKPNDETLKKVSEALGVPEDVFYYLALIEIGENVSKGPRARISTLIKAEIEELFDLD